MKARGFSEAEGVDIGGVYSVEGTNLDGSPYRGMAPIQVLIETTCQFAG
jgi:hypothetical protein